MCKGVLNDMCLGSGWLRTVMASRANVDAFMGVLNLVNPSLSDAA